MRKILSVLFAVLLCFLWACSGNLTSKENVIRLYEKNRETFIKAASQGDFPELEAIKGVQKVLVDQAYVDIKCGASGIGSSTHYYGIFFSEGDDLCAPGLAGGPLVPEGEGYIYKESSGDNEYYVQPLGDHYYYYEAHF